MSSSRSIRWLPLTEADPVANQSLDEALLRARSHPTLRFYRWNPPGLSLGYFQRAVELEPRDALPDHRLVRRTTGGKAIFHDRTELTFAWVYPETWLPGSVPSSYDVVHAMLRAAARACFVELENRGAHSPIASDVAGSPWCFHDSSERCQILRGRKVIGTAQRRIDQWVLHHGSILLEEARPTKGTGGLRDVRPTLSFDELEAAIVTAFADGFSASIVPGEPRMEERTAARELARERYGCETFTHRR